MLKELKNRQSALLFKKKVVPQAALKNCLEAARWSPSCYNNQPWKFVLLKGKDVKKAEKILPRGNHWALDAPLVGFIVAKPDDDCISENNQSMEYFQFDCGMAMMSFNAQAVKEGMQIHQMAGYDEKEAKKTLKVPRNYRVLVAFAMGYEDSLETHKGDIHPKLLERIKGAKRVRKPLKEVYSFGSF